MKVETVKCDRCKRHDTRDESVRLPVSFGTRLVDLCATCERKLVRWLEPKGDELQ